VVVLSNTKPDGARFRMMTDSAYTIPLKPTFAETSVPSVRSTTTLPTWGIVLLAADGGHPNTQLVEVGKDATMVTELPLAVIEGDVLVPFMVTDFTSETLTLPCFASRTMVHVNVVVFLQELLTGSA
jgi:hypothetical protein